MTIGLLTGQQRPILMSPRWTITNQVSLPTGSNSAPDRAARYIHAVQFLFIATLTLKDLFPPDEGSGGSRSLGEDQLNIFHSIEDSLASLGVDGRSCLLRLICELQGNAIGRYTVVGELLTLLFTPKRGMNDFLHDYIEAEDAGRDGGDCAARYQSCPFSLTGTLERYRRYMESVSSIEDKPADDSRPFANTIGNDHFALPKVVVN
ncbi:uncharacterized protein [Penaeus vannamei]|uniref:uncharacterized protein isoform X2 n=1 Tax=Penaeus vannamei TaxID=6689 RepID=UPI00387F38D0